MRLPHEKLPGLDREPVIAIVEPVLRAHGVDGVEIIWQTQRGEHVLKLTVERQGTQASTGAGVNLDTCGEISRDLSNAFEVAEVFAGNYRLEVGTPGLDRALYLVTDYERFSGRLAKLKLAEAIDGQKVLDGRLRGLTDAGEIKLEVANVERLIPFDTVASARLVFEWGKSDKNTAKKTSGQRRRSGSSKQSKSHQSR
jgi:ribosome maturation factor RimP